MLQSLYQFFIYFFISTLCLFVFECISSSLLLIQITEINYLIYDSLVTKS
jgi:hypothetical protein